MFIAPKCSQDSRMVIFQTYFMIYITIKKTQLRSHKDGDFGISNTIRSSKVAMENLPFFFDDLQGFSHEHIQFIESFQLAMFDYRRVNHASG